jgi:hypothetical protein
MATETLKNVKAKLRYTLADGTRVPGVTTVLGVLNKPGLVTWANNLGLEGIDCRKFVDVLGRIGTLAHHLVLCHLTGETPDLDAYSAEERDRAENALISFFAWEKDHEVHVVQTEFPMVSERYRFGGTVDLIANIDGISTLVDFKTSKAIFPEHICQVAAYLTLAVENYFPVKQARVLRIGRTEDEGFDDKKFDADELDPYWATFYHALAIYELQKRIRRGRRRSCGV